MNRSPLPRRTPLRVDPAKALAWQQRSRKPLPRSVGLSGKPSERQKRVTKLRRSAYDIVDERSGGRCEMRRGAGRCPNKATEHQHRRPRRSGGSTDLATETAANIYGICRPCHANVESHRNFSYANGWLLHAALDPASEPVWLWSGWVLLGEDGSVTNVEREAS